MRAVVVNAGESLVEERRRLGIESQDERWEGEWHFVNPPKSWHPRLNADIFLVLAPLARRAGLEPSGDSMGVFVDLETDWRIPDQVFVRPDHGTTGRRTSDRSLGPSRGVTPATRNYEPLSWTSAMTMVRPAAPPGSHSLSPPTATRSSSMR